MLPRAMDATTTAVARPDGSSAPTSVDGRVEFRMRTLAVIGPVRTAAGWRLVSTTPFARTPRLDVVCVPGGGGQIALMDDEEVLDFLRNQAAGARYVTSVCTGALLLGAAGPLDATGRPPTGRPTTNWRCSAPRRCESAGR
ncbi:DJ-1/PfpI family protein [Streptomyces sp. NPDC052036]|uniref:DJ-1/PfpI family protein n=1 Tax=Streptomyces sp. NPDC052036 TaxID=3155171 RepID=UPI003433D868